jgi:RNA polymerase sigma factor (TIGR02999 family)
VSPEAPESEITRVLRAHAAGDADALDRLWPLVYEDLRGIARRQLARDGSTTLDPTAVVHEAFLRLAGLAPIAWTDRHHFFALVARAMRRVLVDAARERHAAKRGGGRAREELDPEAFGVRAEVEDLLAVEETLAELERLDPRLARVVECRLFAGLSDEETAEALRLSRRTVERSWQRARAHLERRLAPAGRATDRP